MSEIQLANGEVMEVSINWLTLKLLNDYGLDKLQSKMEESDNQLEAAAIMIYAVLRSNGKKISEEDALSLVSIEDDTIFSIFEIFKEKLETFKKKQEGRAQLKNITK